MKTLKVAYFGTPDFAGQFLEKLLSDNDLPIEVVLVVTQPDKPVGRKQVLTPSPVKSVARSHDLDLYDNPLSPELIPLLAGVDLAVLYAYGDIIDDALLSVPKYGFWNIHPSLLPKYRGASPIAYPLLLGDTQTGVTLMQMDTELDHGPIIAQQTHDILTGDKRPDLESKLTNLGYALFADALKRQVGFNKSQPVPQNHKLSTHTRKLTKEDGFIPLSVLKKALQNKPLTPDELPKIIQHYYQTIGLDCPIDLNNSAKIVYDYFRGLYPWPGIWTKITVDKQEKRLKITSVDLVNNKLQIKNVQLEGKQEVVWQLFNDRGQFERN